MTHITKDFVLAGDAIFTIAMPAEDAYPDPDHYTFRVQKVEGKDGWKDAYFVRLLTGPDNTRDYTYLGKLDEFTGEVRLTAKSRATPGTFSFRLLNRILARVWTDDHAAYEQFGYATHHEGRCGRCGRLLTVPESVETGIGPECARILGLVRDLPPVNCADPTSAPIQPVF